MKSTMLGIGLLVGGLLAAPAALRAEDAAPAPEKAITLQTICPVMGGAIDKNLYVDHDGKRVYICCKGCEAPLKKDPEKYIQKLEAEGITVARLQTTCPVMGGAIDKAIYVDHGGKRIYVCCQGCVAVVRKDPAKYITSMEKSGVALYLAGEAGKAVEPKKPAAGHEGHQR
jgi:YHS domain-containing protein